MINKNYVYAVVGASSNVDKYGHKVFSDLLDKGFEAIPINPKGGTLLGERVYAKLEDVKKKIDVVIFVVPPTITRMILLSVKKLGIKKVWLQPGSESDGAIKFCKDNSIECIYNACIMIKSN